MSDIYYDVQTVLYARFSRRFRFKTLSTNKLLVFFVFKANGSPPVGSATATRQKDQPVTMQRYALNGEHQLVNFTGESNPAPNQCDKYDKQELQDKHRQADTSIKHNKKTQQTKQKQTKVSSAYGRPEGHQSTD